MRIFFVTDKEKASDVKKWIEKGRLNAVENLELANAICVAGGDGRLLHSIHKYWKYKLPFIGINRGTAGFLLNPMDKPEEFPTSFEQLSWISLKLIQGEFITQEEESKTFLAFNDIFCGGSIADFITFYINGELNYFPQREVRGNGIVISTAQGSTGFVLNARGTAALLPLDSQNWFIGGIATGPYPCDQVSPQRIVIEVRSRKPVHGYADGYNQEVKDIKKVIITPTKQTVALGFFPDIDFVSRRTELAQKQERGK